MTTMNKEELMDIGFNKNEAIVYLSLIKFGKADAHQLIQDTKFHKNIVYENLYKLMEKGLVSYILKDGKRIFAISSPNMLVELFEEEDKRIKSKKEKAVKLAEEISLAARTIKHRQEASIYKGIRGIKSFFKETLEGKDYVVFGAPKESVEIMGETFWRNYNLKREDKQIKVRMIFNPSIKAYGDTIKNKLTQIRYFEKEFEPLTETHIQGDKVGIIVWSEEPVLFLIQDKLVAEAYSRFFEDMWEVAKK